MRIFSSLISLALICYGLYWVNDNHPEYKTKALELINQGNFHTLEVRYTGKQLTESKKPLLLRSTKHKILEPELKFYPYLLMEVKYSTANRTTGEGIILWDLVDGEMVIDASSWQKTHGFSDCINAGTERFEFKIINLLAKKGGSLDRDGLVKALHIENDILDTWIDSCRRKKLIVQSGNDYRLHLQEPRLKITPSTKIISPLVTKAYRSTKRISRRYSPAQIKRIAEACFGNDFAIRSTRDIYLPVYSIVVENPDGSLHTTHWNAHNGKALKQSALFE